MQTYKSLVGVLGGMGPLATVDFLGKIAAATPASIDQDHIPLIVHNVPQIPDRSAAIHMGSDAPFLPMLSGVRMLEAAGVEFIAIPCNTAHFWHGRLQRGCRAKIIHIGEAVLAHVMDMSVRPRSIAIMSTRGTIEADIYGQYLAQCADDVIVPEENIQVLVDEAIAGVKGGDVERAGDAAIRALDGLRAGGADCVLLACTELPVAIAGRVESDIAIDATDALAQACVKASLHQLAFEMTG